MSEEETRPVLYSHEWSDWIMKQFHEDEIVEGNPRVDALRRMVSEYIGTIVLIDSQVESTPCEGNNYRSVVKVVVEVIPFEGLRNTKRTLSFSGVADASNENLMGDFKKFPTAMAETRAEGRALRKLLGIRNVVAAEELSEDTEEKITSTQVAGVENLCKMVGVNLKKFLVQTFDKDQLSAMTKQEAKLAMKLLSGYQVDGPPEEIAV